MSDFLLNPGPTNTTFSTKLAQWRGSDICHRADAFSEKLEQTKDLLLTRFGNKGFDAAILGGSGTLGMEAMIASLFPSETVHIINAGTYGQRAIDICKTYNLKYKEIIARDLDSLKRDTSVRYLCFAENETTTGENFSPHKLIELFPLADLFIDATSSFGASNYTGLFGMIKAICFSGNKCLQGTTGAAVVIYDPCLKIHSRSYYSNLSHYQGDNIPFTVPTQSVAALNHVLLKNYNCENLLNERRGKLITALAPLGIRCINSYPCNSIVGFQHPSLTYDQLRKFLLDRKMVIYSGIPSVPRSFRLSTISNLFDRKFKHLIKTLHDSCLS